jgi:hypothetical protein
MTISIDKLNGFDTQTESNTTIGTLMADRRW